MSGYIEKELLEKYEVDLRNKPGVLGVGSRVQQVLVVHVEDEEVEIPKKIGNVDVIVKVVKKAKT